VNVFAADTDAEARKHFTSLQMAFLNLRRGRPGQVPPPVEDMESVWSAAEKAGVEHALRCSFVGSADTVEKGLRDFLAQTRPDELMIAGHFYDHGARLRSMEITAEVRDRLNARG
jgi:alkanesulfonate monooxygenase SsuD/methylene tetrahydromethanopterin reductase-like flavin-dependent oxidoreductase (luciferase family)